MVVDEKQKRQRVFALIGAIPGIAIAAGLLSLDETSPVRQEYWPWLPAIVFAIGLGSSLFFWLVLAKKRKD